MEHSISSTFPGESWRGLVGWVKGDLAFYTWGRGGLATSLTLFQDVCPSGSSWRLPMCRPVPETDDKYSSSRGRNPSPFISNPIRRINNEIHLRGDPGVDRHSRQLSHWEVSMVCLLESQMIPMDQLQALQMPDWLRNHVCRSIACFPVSVSFRTVLILF